MIKLIKIALLAVNNVFDEKLLVDNYIKLNITGMIFIKKNFY